MNTHALIFKVFIDISVSTLYEKLITLCLKIKFIK